MAEVTGDIGGNPVELNNAATETTLKQLLAATLAMASSKGGKGATNLAELEKELKRLADQSKKLYGVRQQELAEEQKALAEKKKLRDQERKQAEANALALGSMAGAAMQAASKLTDMISALASVGNSLEQAAGSLRQIPVVGGLLAGMFGAVAGAASQTYKSFQQASTVGANFGGSITDMIDAAIGAGLTFDQFSSLIAKNGEALTLLGGSTTEGAKRMAELGKALRTTAKPLGDDLARLGYSTEQINEGLAKYSAMQAKSGSLQRLSNDQLIAQTGQYLKNLDAVSKLTGKSKEALQAEEEARRRDAQFRIAERSIRQEDRKNVDAFMNALPSKDMQDAFKEMLATGALTGPAAQKLAAVAPEMANSLLSAAQQAKRSGKFSDETAGQLDKTLKNQSKALAESGRLNVFGAYLADQYGDTVNGVLDYSSRQSDLNETMKKNATEEEAARKKAAEAAKQGLDPASMKAYQEQIAAVSNQFTTLLATSGLLEGMMTVFQGFVKFVGTFLVPAFQVMGDYAGVLGVGLGAMAAVVGLVNAQLALNNFMKKMENTSIGQSILTRKAELLEKLKSIGLIKLFNLPLTLAIAAIGGLIYVFKKFGGDLSVVTDGLQLMWSGFKTFLSYLKLGFYKVLDSLPGVDYGKEIKATQQEINEQEKERIQLTEKMASTMKKNREEAEKETEARKESTETQKEQVEEQQKKRDYSSPEALLKDVLKETQKQTEKAVTQPGAKTAEPPKKEIDESQRKALESMSKKIESATQPGATAAPKLGGMAAQFESGKAGSQAVGWDSTGGTSYGKYQIAAKTGTMDKFMEHLKKTNPEAHERLSKAGSADAGKDGAFAQEWKKLAGEGKLQQSEHEFIKKTHFDVGASKLKDPNLKGMLEKSKALQEVMWSTSVQHGGGGAGGIFNKVYKEGMSEQDLIKAIYAERGTKFGSSTAQVRSSVQNRFSQEQQLALGMVGQPSTTAAPTSTQVASAITKPSTEPKTTASGTTTPKATSTPSPAPARESAETLLASLNTKMDQLIKINQAVYMTNERQLSVQKGLTSDLFASV